MKNLQKNLSGKLKKKNGFTLIEMLIVVAIIAILVVVSIPLVTTSLNKAREATDDANIRAAKATAVMEYLGNNKNLTTAQFYDAKNGKLVAAKTDVAEAYGQTTDNDGKIIEVKVTEPTAGSTDGPIITCTWVDKG